MNATIILLAIAVSQPGPDDEAAAALALAQAEKIAESQTPAPAPMSGYDRAYHIAVKENRRMIIFIGGNQPKKDADPINVRYVAGIPANTLTVWVKQLAGSPANCIVITEHDGEGLMRKKATLSAQATDAMIAAAIKGVMPMASPFDKSNRRLPLRQGEVLHDVDLDMSDPQLRELLEDMEPYESAVNTQTTFRRWSGYIAPSPRFALESKWLVPGHMDGVHGWSSKLYRKRGVRADVFLVRQDPNDGNSAVTWGRIYPDTKFVDVLRNADGRLFEARVAEKVDGKWSRFVDFADKDHRPTGYVKPTSAECRACHVKAGRSEYGGAAIPGDDTVLSEPLWPVESGQTVQGGYGTRLN